MGHRGSRTGPGGFSSAVSQGSRAFLFPRILLWLCCLPSLLSSCFLPLPWWLPFFFTWRVVLTSGTGACGGGEAHRPPFPSTWAVGWRAQWGGDVNPRTVLPATLRTPGHIWWSWSPGRVLCSGFPVRSTELSPQCPAPPTGSEFSVPGAGALGVSLPDLGPSAERHILGPTPTLESLPPVSPPPPSSHHL